MYLSMNSHLKSCWEVWRFQKQWKYEIAKRVSRMSFAPVASSVGLSEKLQWQNLEVSVVHLKSKSNRIFSGTLQNGSEWHQDCLAHLLKLLCQLGVPLEDRHSLELFDSFGIASLLPNITKSKRRRYTKQEKLVIPCLNQVRKICRWR